MTAYLVSATVHLGALLLLLLAAIGVGDLALRRQRFDSLVERIAFTAALGLGLCASILFVLGIAGLLYREAVALLTALGAALALCPAWRFYRWIRQAPPRPDAASVLVVAAGCGLWLVLLQLPLYPPMNWDSTAYHLILAREYLARHAVVAHPGVVLPVVPALNHTLFAWALALRDDVVAQLVEHAFMMLTALALYAWGTRRRSRGLAVAAAAFWLGQPLVLWLGEAAYVDVANACYAFLGVYALRVFRDGRDPRWWYLSMALLAMAAGVRVHGLVFLALAAAFGLWASLRSALRRRDLAVGWAIGLLLAGPWYAFVAHHTGNPFWPAVVSLSHGPWRPGSEYVWQAFGQVGVPKTLANFLSLPLRLGLDPGPFLPDDHRGLLPIIIAFPVAWLVALVDRSVRWWTLWALAYTAVWFLTSQQIRFWIAALPPAGLAILESAHFVLVRLGGGRAVSRAVWTALALLGVVTALRVGRAEMRVKGWPPPSTPQAREAFLARTGPSYRAITYINRHASAQDAVYSINLSWLNYHLAPRVVDYSGLLEVSGPRPTFEWPGDAAWTRKLDADGVKWILVNHAFEPLMVRPPRRDPAADPFWPDWALVYADPVSWVFRRRPLPGGAP